MRPKRRYFSFESFFDEELGPLLTMYESRRRRRLYTHAAIVAATAIAMVLILLSGMWLKLAVTLCVALFCVVGFLVPCVDMTLFRPHMMRLRFSSDVIRRCIDFAAPGMEYRQYGYVTSSDFVESGLFFKRFNAYRGRNYFRGNRSGYHLSLSWVKAEYLRRDTDKDEPGAKVLSGWLYRAAFQNRFYGRTFILPDKAEAGMGWFGRALQEMTLPEDAELLLLEDEKFEDLFKVMSTGQSEARYILTPAVMQSMVRLASGLKGRFCVSFVKNRMYVLVPDTGDFFDRMLRDSYLEPRHLQQLHFAVKGVERLAETIARHIKVWDRT